MGLINDISSILKTDRLDVVVMNDAPLLLNYSIIREGKILDSKDEVERVMFEIHILSRYLDRMSSMMKDTLRGAAERYLQLALECTLDIGEMIISKDGLESLRDSELVLKVR